MKERVCRYLTDERTRLSSGLISEYATRRLFYTFNRVI